VTISQTVPLRSRTFLGVTTESGALRIPLLAGNGVRLFLTSATLLFFELLVIRWIPANVTYIGFFSNFLLMSSFLGIGLGILLGRRGWSPGTTPFALVLLALVGIVFKFQLNVRISSTDEVFFGLTDASRNVDTDYFALVVVIVLTTALMTALAMPLGPLLKSMKPLRAYAIDIAGSMAGIAGFTLLSAAGTNPLLWFTIGAVLLLMLELGRGIRLWSPVAVAAVAFTVFLVAGAATSGEIWSPYYRIRTFQDSTGLTHITVNGIPHQALHPLAKIDREPFYQQVFKWFPDRTYANVLVVGAGSGSDVALQLSKGAGHIDAVEIDPAIQQLGIDRHPNHPYDDPRVSRINNDGRAYLRNTSAKYDLIVFALPDSLTLVSTTANLRLESFLFTEQAFASVRDHLNDNGIFILYNYYREPWLITKLANQLDSVFGSPPILRLYDLTRASLAAGPGIKALNGGPTPGDRIDPIPVVGDPAPRHATDDWPFLYLRQGFIAPYYLVALALILIGALAAVAAAAAVTGTSLRRFSPHFFVLGVAFLLLETRSLVSFSLLFGTTWFVNALAFFAILASVLLAIFVNSRFPIRRPTLLYVGLFATLGLAFLLPPESLLIDPPILRYALAAALAFAPVFFANLVFSYSFRDTATADMAFASNLLGAMVGGALEYLALLTGYQALLLVVAGLYGLAYIFATRLRLLADHELAADEAPVAETHPAGAIVTNPG
jgi:hypothetical protein